jgi:amphi-Trp domain-containing protein
MSDKETLAFQDTVSAKEAAGFLEALAKSLREGSVLLESGDTSLGLQIGSEIKVDLQAQSNAEKKKGAIELTLSWRAAEQVETPPSLEIVPGALVPAGTAAED